MAYMDTGLEKFTSIHDRLAIEMWICLQETDKPKWMTIGKTSLIQKDPKKEPPKKLRTDLVPTDNMEKLTVQNREEIHDPLISRRLFPKEEKGCFKRAQGTWEFVYVDELILKDSKVRQICNYGVDWLHEDLWYGPTKLDNRRKTYKISDEFIKFIENTTKNWIQELVAGWKSLAKVKIQGGIFQGDALSPLIFVIAMFPLKHILGKYKSGYKLHNS